MRSIKVSYGAGLGGIVLTGLSATIIQGMGYTGGQATVAGGPVVEAPSAQTGGAVVVTEQLLEAKVAGAEARAEAKTNALGGRIDTLNATMAALKDRFDDFGAKFAAVPTDLAALKVRVDHLPTKGFIVWTLTAAVTLAGGIALAADRIKALFA